MVKISPVLYVLGIFLTIIGVAMLLPAAVDFFQMNHDWEVFTASAALTCFVGGGLMLTCHPGDETVSLTIKEAFLLTSLSWVVVVAFAAIPLRFAGLNLDYADSFFEIMSGITTTGATTIVGLDSAPDGINLWRGLMCFLGGIGIIVLAMAVLPMLNIGGMSIFRTESSDKYDKILPKARHVAAAIFAVYSGLVLSCWLALVAAGTGWIDGFVHAAAAIATAGFSTFDASVGHYNSVPIEIILIIGMVMGSLPFVLYIQFLRGDRIALWKDGQVRWFLAIWAGVIGILTLWQYFHGGMGFWLALRQVAFNITSIISTTGFASTDYNAWGPFPVMVFFAITTIGGCTGSTTGGIKIFRLMILYEVTKCEIRKLVQPHGVFVPQFNGKPIGNDDITAVMSFILMFGLTFILLSLGVAATGADFATAMSSVAACMANTGPGIGDIVGPAGNYSSLTNTAKWLLSAGMLLGRLEIFTIIVLFSRYFWRN